MTSNVKPVARPLSPHLQIYRLPLTAVLSIMHRITGVGLMAGLLLITWWVTSAASGPEAYMTAMECITSWFGQLVLFGFTAALYFHLCNGIRHLVWDAGRAFELTTTAKANVLVLFATLVLTVGTWVLALI